MSDRMELEQLHDQGGELVTTATGSGQAPPVGGASVEMGRSRMTVGETLELRQGSIITLDRWPASPSSLRDRDCARRGCR